MTDKEKDMELKEKEANMELDLEDLEQVTGGSLKNAAKKSTTSISSSTKSKL